MNTKKKTPRKVDLLDSLMLTEIRLIAARFECTEVRNLPSSVAFECGDVRINVYPRGITLLIFAPHRVVKRRLSLAEVEKLFGRYFKKKKVGVLARIKRFFAF
jgi:hypothetical protein